MVNYAVPVDVLLPYLPNGCELDLFQGEAYVNMLDMIDERSKIEALDNNRYPEIL